jgi:hypothetical protein
MVAEVIDVDEAMVEITGAVTSNAVVKRASLLVEVLFAASDEDTKK